MAIKEKPICKSCGSKFTYVRIDGTVVCRACGNIEKKAG